MRTIVRKPHASRPDREPQVAPSKPPDPSRWPRFVTEVARAAVAVAALIAFLIERF